MKTTLLAATVALAHAAVPADQVTTIPGYGAPLSNLYSGYLQGGTGKQAHYVFIESLNKPATDDVVLWLNGGPGCSSMDGLFSENGLYHIVQFSNPPVLETNPFAWANITSNLYIESPAGVGFSYCETASGCHHNDTSTANDNLAALVSFFTSYPEYLSNNFWISGESYAGIYVPTLAYAVYQWNAAGNKPQIPLKGIMVGNGCLGNEVGTCGADFSNADVGLNDYHDIMQWRGHGLVGDTLFNNIMTACDWTNESNQCNKYLNQAAALIADLDVYYLYNTCSDPAAQIVQSRIPYHPRSMKARIVEQAKKAGRSLQTTDPNCFSTGPTLEAWFNQPSVKSAFHVAPAIDFALCSNNNTFQYSPNVADERTTIYPTLISQAGYKVLVFNGEADLCVPWTDNAWWTGSMNYTVAQDWHPWTVVGSEGTYVGGYATVYSPPGSGSFAFVTVRGAGHMVPETRPEAALTLLKKHIFQQGWN